MKHVEAVVMNLIFHDAHRATKFVSPTEVVRATRRLYRADRGRIPKRGPIEIVLHLGRPNARELKIAKQYRKAGEPFPVKNLRFEFPAKPKKRRVK